MRFLVSVIFGGFCSEPAPNPFNPTADRTELRPVYTTHPRSDPRTRAPDGSMPLWQFWIFFVVWWRVVWHACFGECIMWKKNKFMPLSHLYTDEIVVFSARILPTEFDRLHGPQSRRRHAPRRGALQPRTLPKKTMKWWRGQQFGNEFRLRQSGVTALASQTFFLFITFLRGKWTWSEAMVSPLRLKARTMVLTFQGDDVKCGGVCDVDSKRIKKIASLWANAWWWLSQRRSYISRE